MDPSDMSVRLKAAASAPWGQGKPVPQRVAEFLGAVLEGATESIPKTSQLDEIAAQLLISWKQDTGGTK